MKYLLAVTWICWLLLTANGQQTPVIRYTEKDDLPHAIVYRLLQDSKGYLWISTDNGLSRYDGTQFVNYSKSDGLASSFIFGTLELSKNCLLVSCYENGTWQYTPGKGFSLYQPLKSVPYPIDYFSTSAGLFVVNRNHLGYFKGKQLKLPDGSPLVVTYILETDKHEILAFGRNMIHRFDRSSSTFRKWYSDADERIYFNGSVSLPGGDLLLSEYGGIYHFSTKLKKKKLLFKGNFKGGRKTFLRDHNGNSWIAELNGNVWLLDSTLRNKRLIATDVMVNQFLEDRENNVWLATYGQGLWCIPNVNLKSRLVRGELIRDIGFFSENGKRKIVPLNQRDDLRKPYSDPSFFNRLTAEYLFESSVGLVFSNEQEMLFSTQLHITKVRGNNSVSLAITNTAVTKIVKSDTIFWCGSRNGLFRIGESFATIQMIPEFRGLIVYDLFVLPHGNVAVATSNGFFVGGTSGWKRYGAREGITDLVINTTCFDSSRKELWVGTNNGVYRVSPNGRVNEVTSFRNIRCNDIEIDRNNRIWLATGNGLYTTGEQGFVLFDKVFGMQSGIRKMAYDDRENRLYALFYNQILEIPVDDILQTRPAIRYRIQLDEALVNNKTVHTLAKNTLLLGNQDKSLSLLFSLPVFKYSGQFKMYYSLNGESWQSLSGHRNLRLYQVPYGENTLEVIALDFSGKRVSLMRLIIRHPKPFYLNNWFLVFVFLLLILLIVLFVRQLVRRKIRKAERQLETQQQLAELRQKSLQNMLNPHFLNNAINSIQAFVVRNDQRNTLRYLSKLAKLMRLNLELMEASFVTLEKELNNIELYLHFEQIRSGEKLVYSFTLSPDIDPAKQLIPAFILQPYVENAIWHGILPKEGVGTVAISVLNENDRMVISIVDDGIGIAASESRKSNHNKISRGTRIIQERLALLNKKQAGYEVGIFDHTITGGLGTEVRILIPMTRL